MKMPYTGVSPPPSRARALIRSILLGCSLIYKKAKYINHLGKYYLCAPPYVYIYIYTSAYLICAYSSGQVSLLFSEAI